MQKNLSAQVARNAIVQIIGKAVSAALGLAVLAVMARYLRAIGFGQYATIITFLSVFAIMADFGLTLVTSQMISQAEANQEKLMNNLFSLRLISAVVFLGLAPLAVFFFPYEPIVKIGVAVTSLSFFLLALNQILVGFFQKNLTMTIVAWAEILSRVILLAGVILTAFLDLGLLSIMAATVASSAASFILHYWFSRRFIKIKWEINWLIWRQIARKSWPLGLTIFLNLIYLRADIFILSLLKDQSQVGIYGAAYKIIDVLTALPFMFAGLVLPILSANRASRDADRFNKILSRSLDAMFMLAAPLVIGAQIVAEPLVILVAGENFKAAGAVLRILILAIGFIFIGCLMAHAVIALDKQKKMIAAYGFTALTALLGYLIFIPLYSYYGAAWVTVYSELAIALFSLYVAKKYGRFKLKLNILFKSIAAALIMAVFAYLSLGRLNLIFIIGLAAFIYFVCLYLFKGISKRDLKNLIS